MKKRYILLIVLASVFFIGGTVFLASNVSKDVLNAFNEIEEGIEQSNQIVDEKTWFLEETITINKTDYSEEDLKSLDSLNLLFDDLETSFYDITKPFVDTKNVAVDDLDFTNKFFYEEGNALKLKTSWNDQMMVISQLSFMKGNEDQLIYLESKTGIHWQAVFYNVPYIGAKTILKKIESDLLANRVFCTEVFMKNISTK